ncbi:MAG: hypothetical protein ACTH5S_10215 [Hafnia alvei]|uniref:hypothetical protein n=1 Tax=Hafnia alvei TaxID=569 RepID=UPI003F8F3A56
MYQVLGSEIHGGNNIPREIHVGYDHWPCGKVYSSDGQFVMYLNLSVTGSNGQPIDHHVEDCTGFTVDLLEVPCDSAGNNLMDHYKISKITNYNWPNGSYFVQIAIFCKKEPTHRINTSTGEVINNDSDEQYISAMPISYILIKP